MKKLLTLKRSLFPVFKYDLKMKLSTLFIIAALFTMQAKDAYGQRTKVTLNLKNVSVERLIDEIESKTEFEFVYKIKDVNLERTVSVNVNRERIANVLKTVFKNTNTTFNLNDRRIYLVKREESEAVVPEESNLTDDMQFSVSGTITDESGQPLPGANIVEKGTSNGTQTDFDGNFSIAVANENTTLVISYIGFAAKEVQVNGQSSIQITLLEDSAQLDEVVIVGYGSVTKAKLTGSVASIKSDDFEDIPVTSVEQAIAGQLPGVEITQNTGEPGTANGITIRGTSTITAGTQPLIVVDGLALSETTSLNTINPNDIASVEVLKDAASAAIYGSRGANGVIIITTKSGQEGKPQFSFNSFAGFQQVAERLDLLNAYQHAEFSRDARNNYYLQFDDGSFSANDDNATRETNAATLGFNPRKAIIPSFMQPYLDGVQGLTDTDWQDELFRNALIQNYQLSVRGGGPKSKYFISGDYFDQQGVVRGTDFERFSFRANFEAQLSNDLKFGINFAPSLQQNNVIETGFSNGPINSLYTALPFFPAYNEDGTLAISNQVSQATEGDQARTENPVALATLNKDFRRTLIFQGGTFLEYEVLDGLKAKTYWGVDLSSRRRDLFRPSSVGRRNNPAPVEAFGLNSSLDRLNWLVENTLDYTRTFGENHNLNLLAGFTYQEQTEQFNETRATGFPNDLVETLNAGIIDGGRAFSNKSTLVSYLARLRYDYAGKYLLTAAIRRDGSSRFGANNRYGTFPSISAGYRISEESFFPKSDSFNELKIRASWGLTGNNQIGDFGSQALLGPSNAIINDNIASGLSLSTSPNANLTWEQTSTIDFGLDLGFFNNRLSASFDYYVATTDDLLLQVPVPAHSGFENSLQNIGKVENRGFEAAIRANYEIGAIKFRTSFNLATNKNEVLELGPGQEEIISGGRSITRIGGELGANYGYVTDGIFQSQSEIDSRPSLSTAQVGEYIYVDANGDGQINGDDRVEQGSVFPDYTLGINQNISYKNFDLGVVLQSVQGVTIHNRTNSVLLFNPEGWSNQFVDYFNNYYTPERGENAIYARPNSLPRDNGFYRETDLLKEDASFIRIRNITLGYTFPSSITETLKITSLRVYLSSKNPFTFTDYRGFNPEQRRSDNRLLNSLNPVLANWSNYPLEKSFVLGFNLTF
ncbi:TonB-dependent receptor [Flagellimonas onchidii]|uniref:TonB-dependent receptor n=1 Tax=Flagellimonas onchidii TaxID=2562684 RepID=UPI0010A5EB99|nr:TonB-dependent receptor [Allomuricauda onchidii]